MSDWIELEQNCMSIAGYEVELDVRARGQFYSATRPAYEFGQIVEPAEPADFELEEVEFRPLQYDQKTKRHVPAADWREIPINLIFPVHRAAIVLQCIDCCLNEIQAERDAAAEARRDAS